MDLGSIDTASTIMNSPPTWRAFVFRGAYPIGLRPIGAFTQAGSLRDPSAFTSRRCPAVAIPTASTNFSSKPGFEEKLPRRSRRRSRALASHYSVGRSPSE